MKKVFLDTNILIDLIAERKPFSKYAIDIFDKAENNLIKIYTSSHSIATSYYLLKKHISEKDLREILYALLDYLIIIPLDADILKKGLRSRHKDFEDGLQIMCAYSKSEIDCIVTRNIKDFKYSEIPVFTPDQFLEKLM